VAARPSLELRDASHLRGSATQYVAEQLGHSAATLLRDYARVWEDFDPSQRVSAEEQIERVRSRAYRIAPTQSTKRGGGRHAPRVFRAGSRVP
jgi:hypothetical protein